jgi:translation elongation factor EF-4
VFDSWFDQYRGVVVLVHVVDGKLEPRMKVRLMATGGTYEVEQLGVFTPKPVPVDALAAGEVGFVIAGIKKVADVAIGDTLTDDRRPAPAPLPGFKEIKPMVFASTTRPSSTSPRPRPPSASASAAASSASSTWRSWRSGWSASSTSSSS